MSASNTTNTNTDEWADFTQWQGGLMAGVESGGPVGCLCGLNAHQTKVMGA